MNKRNEELNDAKNLKKDEFYTDMRDIELELVHYKEQFKDKKVLCNCDDYRISNFVRFFKEHFEEFGLKRLTAVCYKEQIVDLFSESISEPAFSYVYDGKEEIVTELKCDGDFRSLESQQFLEDCDIVVTNPPFSLFREFVEMLIKSGKKFLIIGNMNAVSCKEIFPLFKDKKMSYGISISSGDRKFYVPDDYDLSAAGCGIDSDGKRFIRVKGVRWFTNLKVGSKKEPMILVEKYSEEKYPRFDNYDAINVDKTKDIPMDYFGEMGVPITFLDRWSPDAEYLDKNYVTTFDFDIIGLDRYTEGNRTPGKRFTINGKELYARVVIIRKKK